MLVFFFAQIFALAYKPCADTDDRDKMNLAITEFRDSGGCAPRIVEETKTAHATVFAR